MSESKIDDLGDRDDKPKADNETGKDRNAKADGAMDKGGLRFGEDLLKTIERHVDDPNVQSVLKVVVLLALIAVFFGKLFQWGDALNAALLMLLFFGATLLLIVIVPAFKPIGDEEAAAKIAAAVRKQKNARGGLLLASVGIVIFLLVLNFLLLPIWPMLVFEFDYQRLKAGAMTLAQFPEQRNIPWPVRVDGVFYPGEEELPLDGNRVRDSRTLLRLVTQPSMTVLESLRLRSIFLKEHQTAVIAARRVFFNASSSIQIGASNLLIITQDLEIDPRQPDHKSDSAIFAYSPEDMPPNYGLRPEDTGVEGGNAGSVTIIVLGNIAGDGVLAIDLRGQRGGQGAKGKQPDPRPDRLPRTPVVGHPHWSFRKPSVDEVTATRARFDDERQHAKGDPGRLRQIDQYEADFTSCTRNNGPCRFVLCDEKDWKDLGKGDDGEKGEPGGQGGRGGPAGKPGTLTILVAKLPEAPDEILKHFKWVGAASVSSVPPQQLGGPGGPTGDPGQPGAESKGLPPDVVGACQAGLNGTARGLDRTEHQGEPGEQGPLGKRATLEDVQNLMLAPK